MDYKFFLNDLEIDEPIGWSAFELSLKRDETSHGMQFEASTGTLRFFGAGANYLIEQKNTNGIKAHVTLIVQEACDTEYEEVFIGRLNFGKYKDTCGTNCLVNIPVEEEGCKVSFKNKFDQKVDVDSQIALNKTSVLADYAQLGQIITLPAKALQASVDGSVNDDGYDIDIQIINLISGSTTYARPDYDIERYNNIATGQLTGVNNCVTTTGGCIGPITPQLLFDDNITCFDGNFEYTSRLKGTFDLQSSAALFLIKHKIFKWDGTGNIFSDSTLVQEVTIFDGLPTPPSGPLTQDFDSTLTGTTTIADGEGFYAVLEFGLSNSASPIDVNVMFDSESLFTINAVKICPDTETEYYMVHECLSRVVEAITDKCMRVKSEYYGRTDSQPFAFEADGCGSLRFFTNGLKIRNTPDGKFFASAKDLLDGLRAIDNIGFSIEEDDDIEGRFILRVEPVGYFYKDEQIFAADFIPIISNEVQESMHYSKINVGYKKWEIETVNGLNELHSNREYRTNVDTINSTIDITSALVAGSYPIEITRQQNFADSGAEDATYDNDIFIICVYRGAYDFLVEQGLVNNAENIFDPGTIYNYRISPIRNLMRWFKSIINTYTNITSTTNRLFFSSGKGNFTASGNLNSTFCKLEKVFPIGENFDIWHNDFANVVDYTPFWKNETASFEYPLSFSEYNRIKANPYGYVAYTCGNDSQVNKAFIKEIKYQPAKGRANFTLIKKWE